MGIFRNYKQDRLRTLWRVVVHAVGVVALTVVASSLVCLLASELALHFAIQWAAAW